jgi:hypothetical protein
LTLRTATFRRASHRLSLEVTVPLNAPRPYLIVIDES